jgi:hypothetical protein
MNFSKAKKRREAGIATAVLLAAALTLSACGVTKIDPISVENAGGTNSEGDQLPAEGGIMEPGSPGDSGQSNDAGAENGENASGSDEQGTQETPEGTVTIATGTFNGIIDNNSIEITTDNGTDAYRFTEELSAVVNELPEDAKVFIQYTVTPVQDDPAAHQNWLQSIEQMTQ